MAPGALKKKKRKEKKKGKGVIMITSNLYKAASVIVSSLISSTSDVTLHQILK